MLDQLIEDRKAGRVTRNQFITRLDQLAQRGEITQEQYGKAVYEFGQMPSDNRESTIIECVECGGTVSTKAKTCPHCGAPPTKAKQTGKALQSVGCFLTIFVTIPIVLLFMFGMCA